MSKKKSNKAVTEEIVVTPTVEETTTASQTTNISFSKVAAETLVAIETLTAVSNAINSDVAATALRALCRSSWKCSKRLA